MTADECRLILKQVFKKLYPNCNVQDSYPGDLPRSPLPYVVLDFGRVDTQKVDSSFNGRNGILYQSWHQSMPLTVELVSGSKTKHTDKEKLTSRSTVVDDLVQAVLFFQSPMARDKMLTLNMAVDLRRLRALTRKGSWVFLSFMVSLLKGFSREAAASSKGFPEGLRPQARVGAQPPKAALST